MRNGTKGLVKYAGIAGVAALGALVVGGIIVGPERVEFTHHEIGDNEAPGTQPIRFAQLSDLHVSSLTGLHQEIIETLATLELDFILLTGDTVCSNRHLRHLDDFLALLPHALPKYAILGNWEYFGGVDLTALAEIYSRHNTRLLVNETTSISVEGKRIVITGLDDLVEGKPDLERALEGVEPADHHLLLAHCPAQRDLLALIPRNGHANGHAPQRDLGAYGITGIFSGHTHGGQVRFLGVCPYLPKGSGRYIDGWYRDGSLPMYVSRGIGTSMVRIRIGSRPEVPIFTLYA